MVRTRTTNVLRLAGICGALALAAEARAGGDKVVFPEGFEKGTRYATVDRYDVKQYRELWSTPAAVEAVRAGKPIPSGTVLTLVQYKAQVDAQGNPVKDAQGRFLKGDLIAYTVMEKRTGWGTEYPDDVRNGEWEYQAFGPDKAVNDKANLKACFGCHKPHAGQDFVISLASLSGVTSGTSDAPRPGARTVSIADFLFGPEKVTVAAGQPITWTNTDASPHQVSVQGKPQRTKVMLKGQSAELAFNEAGTFNYICGLHPNMKGSIEVK
jgi:plastocyanin